MDHLRDLLRGDRLALPGVRFGPVGIIIAAVRVNGNRGSHGRHLNGPRRRVRIVRHGEEARRCATHAAGPANPETVGERLKPPPPSAIDSATQKGPRS